MHSANDISRVLENIREYLRDNVGRRPALGDRRQWSPVCRHGGPAGIRQVYSLWGALVLIFVFMLFFLRSFWAALLCMIPNLSPIFLIFAIMGLTGIWLDMATAMIASVAIGIAVTTPSMCFTVSRRVKRRRTVVAWRAPIVGRRAVVTTTIILSAQFLILVVDFVPTRNFGLLTTVGLVSPRWFSTCCFCRRC